MMTEEYTHGFRKSVWDKAKAEMRDVLEKYARDRVTVPYSILVKQVQTIRFEHHERLLSRMLCAISEDTNDERGVLLSVIVVRKRGDQRPGRGFLYHATKIRENHVDVEAELQRVWDAYAGHP